MKAFKVGLGLIVIAAGLTTVYSASAQRGGGFPQDYDGPHCFKELVDADGGCKLPVDRGYVFNQTVCTDLDWIYFVPSTVPSIQPCPNPAYTKIQAGHSYNNPGSGSIPTNGSSNTNIACGTLLSCNNNANTVAVNSNIPCDINPSGSGVLCLPPNPVCRGNTNSFACGGGSVLQIIVKIINILLYFAGIVAVILIIIGGYQFMTAGGNETVNKKGKNTIVNAIIGLVIVILAYVIVQAVTAFLT